VILRCLQALPLTFAANLVLQDTIERIFSGKRYFDVPRGLYLVRGENVVLLGEIVSLLLGSNLAKSNPEVSSSPHPVIRISTRKTITPYVHLSDQMLLQLYCQRRLLRQRPRFRLRSVKLIYFEESMDFVQKGKKGIIIETK
jgi:hypothetical protein